MDATREQRIAARREAEAKENAQPPAKEQPLRRQLIDELETVR